MRAIKIRQGHYRYLSCGNEDMINISQLSKHIQFIGVQYDINKKLRYILKNFESVNINNFYLDERYSR